MVSQRCLDQLTVFCHIDSFFRILEKKGISVFVSK